MRRHFVRFVVPLMAGALIVLAAKVTTDYSHTADFSHYSTYSWLDVKARNPLWPDRIMSAVDSQLAAKGWSKVPAGGDVSVCGVWLHSYPTKAGNVLYGLRRRLVLAGLRRWNGRY